MSAIDYGSIPGIDITCKNTSALAIAAGTGVIIDTAHAASGDTPPGVLAPTNGGGVVGTLGIAIENIAVGQIGKVRVSGTYPVIAHGGVTAGAYLQVSDTAAHLGQVKTCGAATEQIGQALNTATDGTLVNVMICKANNA